MQRHATYMDIYGERYACGTQSVMTAKGIGGRMSKEDMLLSRLLRGSTGSAKR
jgi:hypothetical protein